MAKEAIHNERLLQKLSKLSPDLQRLFLRAMRDLYDQESDHIRKCIEHGRQEIGESIAVLEELDDEEDDAEDGPHRSKTSMSQLSSKAKQKDEPRRGARSVSATSKRRRAVSPAPFHSPAVREFLPETSKEPQNFEQLSARDLINDPSFRGMSPASSPRYLETPTVMYGNFLRATDSRCSSVAPSKIDFDLELDDYEEESKEILDTMKNMNAHIENERSRQAEMVRRMKEKKKANRHAVPTHEDILFSIMNEAKEGEQLKKKDKERQEKKVRERIEEMKERMATPDPDAQEAKDKKKKKKKDKDKDKNDEENGEEEDDKKKKKSKKKDKEEEENQDEENGKKDKKKKKKKDKDEEESPEEEDGKKDKKKKKKKDKDQDEGAEEEDSKDKKKKKKSKEKDAEAEEEDGKDKKKKKKSKKNDDELNL